MTIAKTSLHCILNLFSFPSLHKFVFKSHKWSFAVIIQRSTHFLVRNESVMKRLRYSGFYFTKIYFFICYFTASRLTLGQYWSDSLIHMLIIAFLTGRSPGAAA